MNHGKYRLIIPFLAPALLLYAVFVLYPYVQAFWISLHQWRGVSANKKYIGLGNYRKLVDDENFWNALTHNAQLLIVLPIFTIGLAMLFATLFVQGGRGVRGANFYRIVFFFPQVMSLVIVGVLWQYIYNPNSGLVNGFLDAVGLDSLKRAWLGDTSTALWAVAAVIVWQAVGFYMVLFVAGMQSIPIDYYEAARLDGASRFAQFKDVTLPLLWENIRVAIVYIAIAALDLFTIVQVMTEGKPQRSSDVVARYMYEQAFTNSQFGYASAIGVVLLLLTLGLSIILLFFSRRERLEF
ncbi:MAG TPA: sugar ABC transporter permease [Thermomicrobiales bacterium]|jgi:N-acetylglucosamine transport system permease protein|nr:sugar ABC transporter permease [Thermomicrobiales bacterium]